MTDLNAFIVSTNGQSALSGLPITHLFFSSERNVANGRNDCSGSFAQHLSAGVFFRKRYMGTVYSIDRYLLVGFSVALTMHSLDKETLDNGIFNRNITDAVDKADILVAAPR